MKSVALKICFFLALSIGLTITQPQNLFAQSNPLFYAHLDQTRLPVGGKAVLTISLEGENLDLGTGIEPPSLSPYFQIEGQLGPSVRTEMSIINGKMTKRMSWKMQYILIAVKPGRFTIPRMAYHSGRQIFYTNPIEVEIVEAKTMAETAGASEKEEPPEQDPYLKLELDRSEYYVGEQIRASWYLYFRAELYNLSLGLSPALADFNVQELESPNQLAPITQTIQGEVWNKAFVRSLALFPLRAGKLTIGGLELRYQRAMGRRDFFGMPLVEEARVRSEPISVIIKSLPEPSPPDFSGAVGNFSLSARLPRTELRQGESTNLELEIIGDGNPDYILEPKFVFPGSFEVYPPEIKLEREISAGKLLLHKKFNYMLVAREEGDFEIPEISFCYFDPKLGQYTYARSKPIKVKVSPGAGAGLIRKPSAQRPSDTLIVSDIRYIKESAQLEQQGIGYFGKIWFWLAHLSGFLLVMIALWYRLYQNRLESDPGLGRKQRAYKQFKKHLKKAYQLVKEGKEKEFSAELRHTILEYFGDRFNQSPWGLLEEDMKEIMSREKISPELIQEFMNLLRDLNQAQYAGKMSLTPEQLLSKSEKLIQTLEKNIK